MNEFKKQIADVHRILKRYMRERGENARRAKKMDEGAERKKAQKKTIDDYISANLWKKKNGNTK